MKKIFFSIVALAALAACTKSEVAYDAPQEIGFAPVAKNATKAAIEGVAFDTTQDLYVFANAGVDGTDDGTTVNIEECTEPYLRNARFTREEFSSAYTGATPYYWPNVKSLSFAGYVDAGNAKEIYKVGDVDTPRAQSNDAMTNLTITGYVQPDTGNNDLMYFFTDASYDKNISGDVPVTMLHSCSWLVFDFIGDSVTGSTTSPWTINEVVVKGITKTGTATLTATGAEWAEGTQNQEYIVYSNLDTGTPLSNGTANTTISGNKNVIVIPQQTASLYIKYSYTSQAGTKIFEEKTVELGYDEDDADEKWNPGIKYTYSVNIGAKQITIMPEANKWENYDTDNPAYTEDVDPIEPTM